MRQKPPHFQTIPHIFICAQLQKFHLSYMKAKNGLDSARDEYMCCFKPALSLISQFKFKQLVWGSNLCVGCTWAFTEGWRRHHPPPVIAAALSCFHYVYLLLWAHIHWFTFMPLPSDFGSFDQPRQGFELRMAPKWGISSFSHSVLAKQVNKALAF